jgi:capsular exopolysaccharide synthesis family protein
MRLIDHAGSGRWPAPDQYRAGPALPAPGPVYMAPPAQSQENFVELMRRLWRQRFLILVITSLFAVTAIIVAKMMPAYYVSEARVLVGVPGLRVLNNMESILADISPDADRIQNEGYIIASRDIAGRTIDKLSLAKDPEFNPALAKPGLLGRTLNWLRDTGPGRAIDKAIGGSSTPVGEAVDARNQMVDQLLAHVEVAPLGRSHVVAIRVRSVQPQTSAAIANTMAALYLERQKEDKVEATNDADKFLADRIAQLRDQVAQSDQAVEDYRRKYGLYKGASAGVTSQQLTELNSQLIIAQTAKAQADSRLQEAQTLKGASVNSQSVPEVLQSPLIASLKTQAAEADRRVADLAARVGSRHPQLMAARAEAGAIYGRINSEVSNIIAGLRKEADAANRRYEDLRQTFEKLKNQMGGVNDKQIRLDALERDATVNRNLLEQMLSRSKEMIGQGELQRPNAKLISAAAPPNAPAFPSKVVIVFLGIAMGGMASVMTALLRDKLDQTFRRGDQVEAATGLSVLALVPQLSGRTAPTMAVMRDPVSPYSEALRKLYIGLELSETTVSPKKIMFASAVPDEGKSVIVASLGRMLASHGRRVLLIDCDWRRPSLHTVFRVPNRGGLASLLTGEESPDETTVITDTISGVDVVVAGEFTPEAVRYMASDRIATILNGFAEQYDLVLLDTPPVLVGAEVLALARAVDKVAFVIRWGKTQREDSMDALKQLLEAQADVAGVVLSRVDAKRYRRYGRGQMDYQYDRPVALKRLG